MVWNNGATKMIYLDFIEYHYYMYVYIFSGPAMQRATYIIHKKICDKNL